MLRSRRQRGAGLVELMVASLIALAVLATLVSVYSATARHSSRQLRETDLRSQIHATLETISSDIRRAGFRAFDARNEPASRNPFQQPGNRLRTGALRGQPDASCILYSYDLDRDGLLGTGRCAVNGCVPGTDSDNVEQFGFRLNRGRIQSRYGGRGFGCGTGNWQAVTTTGIVVDTLNFRIHRTCLNLADADSDCAPDRPALWQRAVELQLGAHLPGDEDFQLLLSRWVHIRNDRLEEP